MHQFTKLTECIADIKIWMTSNFLCKLHFISKLQLIQNAEAQVLTRTRKYDHIGPVLSTLHWLPTKCCIHFKIVTTNKAGGGGQGAGKGLVKAG